MNQGSAKHGDGFTWDNGPTIVLMPEVFEETFAAPGRRIEDYLTLQPLFSPGAQYAEPADELVALWQQARGAPLGRERP